MCLHLHAAMEKGFRLEVPTGRTEPMKRYVDEKMSHVTHIACKALWRKASELTKDGSRKKINPFPSFSRISA